MVIAGLFVIGRHDTTQLARVHLRVRPIVLLAAVPFYAIGSLWLALGWRAQLAAFGTRLPVLTAVRLWWRAQLARYVPTGLAALASRAALGAAVGVPAAVGAGSLVLELAELVGWCGVGAAALLPSASLGVPYRLALGVGSAAGLALLPLSYRRLAGLGGRIRGLAALASTPASRRGLYVASLVYGASLAARTVAFVIFGAALLTVGAGDTGLLAGSVLAAAIVGIIGVTPAGLGVREGAMVALLRGRFGVGDAAALAVAWRAWEFAFELVWLAVGTAFGPRLTPGRAPTPEARA
ncbi:MAG: hypothetical protein NVS1B12_16030 [Acidimicrobiales bacterium]